MRLKPRTDSNQQEIVEALRKVGARVQILSQVGGGCPDLLIAFRGRWFVAEIKDGRLPPSEKTLTRFESGWFEEFWEHSGPLRVIESVDEALRFVGAIK
jgi:hypothetical protein